MNCYVSLDRVKEGLGISDNDKDDALLSVIEGISRMIDKQIDRHFYVWEGTKYYDGSDDPLYVDDLLSIDASGLQTDEDGDLDYDNTFAGTDYHLIPYNVYPKRAIYLSDNGDYSSFGYGVRKGVKITGKWGCNTKESPVRSSGTTITASDSSTTSVTAGDGTKFETGQTIKVENEQMFITKIQVNALTVERAVNGTTGASHSAVNASIYEYPAGIPNVCLSVVERFWETEGRVFQSEKVGDYQYTILNQGFNEIEKMILKPYELVLI